MLHSPREPPHAPFTPNKLSASQQGDRRLLTPAERRVRDKHRTHLAQTRFCPKLPGTPRPFVPWGSVAAAATESASDYGSTSTANLDSDQTPLPMDSKLHARFFPHTLRPYRGSPMRLLDTMPDGKRRTSDLVKCIRAGQVDSMDLSLAIQIPDGFEAVNATRIQAHFRGSTIRKEYRARKKAAVQIQATIRGKLWRNELQHLNWNALWIQTVWRSRKIGWRAWMHRSPMRMDQLHQFATVIETRWRTRTDRERFLTQKRAAVVIQKYVRGIHGRKSHREWLNGPDGPAGLAKERERLMQEMKRAARLLVDDGTAPKQPTKALKGFTAVYKQASPTDMSCGVPQLSQNAVIREMRNKMPTIQEIYEEFVSATRRARHSSSGLSFSALSASLVSHQFHAYLGCVSDDW